MTARPADPPGWRLIGPEMLACPCCKNYQRAPVFGAFGAIVRRCPTCLAHVWSCPSCGNGPAVERDGMRVCPCGWSGHIPTAERPALRLLPIGPALAQEPTKAAPVEVVALVAPPVPPAPVVEPKRRTATPRKPRAAKAPEGQGSLF